MLKLAVIEKSSAQMLKRAVNGGFSTQPLRREVSAQVLAHILKLAVIEMSSAQLLKSTTESIAMNWEFSAQVLKLAMNGEFSAKR